MLNVVANEIFPIFPSSLYLYPRLMHNEYDTFSMKRYLSYFSTLMINFVEGSKTIKLIFRDFQESQWFGNSVVELSDVTKNCRPVASGLKLDACSNLKTIIGLNNRQSVITRRPIRHTSLDFHLFSYITLVESKNFFIHCLNREVHTTQLIYFSSDYSTSVKMLLIVLCSVLLYSMVQSHPFIVLFLFFYVPKHFSLIL